MLLKEVAEAIENVILEDMARKKIASYTIDVIPDDNKIVVYYMKRKAVKKITVSYTIKRGK